MGGTYHKAKNFGGLNLSFDNPQYLNFLLLFIIVIPLVVLRYHKIRKGAEFFASAAPSNERVSLLRELKSRIIFNDIFFLLFSALLIIALSGPRWGVRIVADSRRGIDLVMAFDLSRSMNSGDSYPEGNSRLERGIEIAGETAAALGDFRMGAALGKGSGVLAVPLTYDSETMLGFIHSLGSQAITGSGTNLESLLNAASGAFQDSIQSRRVIVLFSDGEALSGSFHAAVDRLKKEGVTLCTVGLGSDMGAPIYVGKSQDAPEGFLLAEDGLPLISARQNALLKSGSERTDGIYIDGNHRDAAAALIGHIRSLSSELRFSGQRREANPRWRSFVLAAIGCLGGARMMGFSLRKRRRAYTVSHVSGANASSIYASGINTDEPASASFTQTKDKPAEGRKGIRKLGAISLLCCLFLFSSCDKIQGKLLIMEGNFFNTRGLYTEAISSYLKAFDYEDAVPYAEFGLGTAYFALEEGTAALERYRAAESGLKPLERSEHEELNYRIFYNMGIIYFEKGEYSNAADAFRNALRIDGSRIEAKRNLELSLLTITRSSAPQAASAEGRAENSSEGAGSGSAVLFEYLKAKEQEQWKSREWTGENESSALDY